MRIDSVYAFTNGIHKVFDLVAFTIDLFHYSMALYMRSLHSHRIISDLKMVDFVCDNAATKI